MKRYKLLKDLPFAQAGEIFEKRFASTIKDNNEILLRKGSLSHPLFINEIENFDEWFEETKEPEFFYYVDEKGLVWKMRSDDRHSDVHLRKAIGNHFLTEEAAENRRAWLEAERILHEDRGEPAGFWGVKHDWRNDKLLVGELDNNYTYNHISFRTKKDAQASIEKHEKEWKIYLGVDYER